MLTNFHLRVHLLLARMDHMLPLMLHAMPGNILEDSIQAYLIVEAKLRGSASKIIQFTFRKFVFENCVEAYSHFWRLVRVRKSKIRYKFLKHREKGDFYETFIPRRFTQYTACFSRVHGRKFLPKRRRTPGWRRLSSGNWKPGGWREFAKRMRAKKSKQSLANWRCPCLLKCNTQRI